MARKHNNQMQHFDRPDDYGRFAGVSRIRHFQSSLPQDIGCSMLHPGRPVEISILALEPSEWNTI